MVQQQNLIFVLILAVLCQTTWTCKLIQDSKDTALCETLEELASAGSQPEWKLLVLKNSGNVEKKPLQNGVFKDVPNLEKLWIEALINKVEPEVFKQLPKLNQIHLGKNIIEELPEGLFDGLPLEHLEINDCQLKNIKQGTLDKIETVNLRGNQINLGTIFKNSDITTIDLSNNSISNIEDCAFCGMNNLKDLNLQSNLLETFEPVRILGANNPVVEIGLDGNKLTHISKFDSSPNLTKLSVVNNSIEDIEDNSFVKCPKFRLLDVSGNKLKDIPANIFPEFGDREEPIFLAIHNNEIHCLSQELRNKLKTLRRVTVNGNPWKCECLNDVIAWAKDKKAFVGCELPYPTTTTDCKVSCVDQDNKKQVIDVKYK